MQIFSTIKFFLDSGGFTAWLILGSALILVVLAYDRIRFLYFQYSFDASQALEKIREAVLRRNYTQALQICNARTHSPELSVIRSGLIAVEHGREAMKSALGGAVLEVSSLVEVRLPLVSLIAGVSTLLGLLGTITGLIKTFSSLAQADALEKGRLLGEGISEAMYSTATGLAVGIAAMVLHTILSSKGDMIVNQSQNAGYKLVTWIEESERAIVIMEQSA